MAACVVEVLRRARIYTVRREDQTCFDSAAGAHVDYAMDIVVPIRAVRGARDANIREKRILIDVTVPNPSGRTAIRRQRTNVHAGVAAATGETIKHNKYGGTFVAATSHLVPFAVETYGRLGKEAEHFLKELAEHAVGVGADDAYYKSQTVCKFRQLVSVSLQRALSRRELMYVHGLRTREARAVRPIEQMWDLVEGHADVRAATGGARRRGRTRTA